MTSLSDSDPIRFHSNKLAVANAKVLRQSVPDGPRFTWNFRQRDILGNVISQGGFDNFLNWPVVHECLYAGMTDFMLSEREALPERYRYLAADFPWPPSPSPKTPEGASGTFLRQMFLAYLLESNTYMDWMELDSIYEVGGGYGAMQIILRRLGFDGDYIVLDLPAIHLLRNWYLENAGIYCLWENEPSNVEVDLFIASHSIDEMPVDDREKILSKVRANTYIFSITKNFDGVNNQEWIRQMFDKRGLSKKLAHENERQEIWVAERHED